MSLTEAYDPPSRRDVNNAAPRPSQNKSKLLEATMRNVPKLKELNYSQWKNVITNSIKNAKLWGYIDGSIEQPSEENTGDLATYFDEAGAVRNAILGSLESGAQKYIEEALDPRDAWITLEKKYLTAEGEVDAKLVSIEQGLADLRLEEGGDMIEHIAEFCRMRCQLDGTRFALDDHASVIMLYRSMPPSYRQSVLTPEGTEMKEFSVLCARLTYLSQNPEPVAPEVDTHLASAEDYTNWGVPEELKAFGLTGDKNPLLEERAAVTCRDCLLKDHEAGTPECPQYEWRRELWGMVPNRASAVPGDSAHGHEISMATNTKRFSYEFSEPVKVVLDFDELGLRHELRDKLRSSCPKPSAIQQCAILPIISGRNVLAQAPRGNGKTTALAISILQVIDPLPHFQVLVFTSTDQTAAGFQEIVSKLGSNSAPLCYSYDPSHIRQIEFDTLAGLNRHRIVAGTPDYLLELINRKILKTHNLKLLVLDDVDKLIEAGAEEKILEIYRQIPPLAQIAASCTVLSSSVTNTTLKFLVDPLRISVDRGEGISMSAKHFFVKLPADKKLTALYALISRMGSRNAAIICRTAYEARVPLMREFYAEAALGTSPGSYKISRLLGKYQAVAPSDYRIQALKHNTRFILFTTTVAFPLAELPSCSIILVIYDVPSDTEGFFKLIKDWRETHSGQDDSIITFVTDKTDEIHVIQDLERHHGAEVAELLWDGTALH